ncbi:MAG: PaaI family thioesterase [Gammaproteobacteria bacterium]|nr:PaaI family thioesterase [Gammaproteobacteria bacterium]
MSGTGAAPVPLGAADLQRAMDSSPYVRDGRMRVVEFDGIGRLVLEMPLDARCERVAGGGQFHGGAVAGLADTAGCFVLVGVLASAVPTVDLRVDYLRPAVAKRLRATATVRRLGRSVGVVDVDVNGDGGELVAIARGTFRTAPPVGR